MSGHSGRHSGRRDERNPRLIHCSCGETFRVVPWASHEEPPWQKREPRVTTSEPEEDEQP